LYRWGLLEERAEILKFAKNIFPSAKSIGVGMEYVVLLLITHFLTQDLLLIVGYVERVPQQIMHAI
jgi:hypothetical protein